MRLLRCLAQRFVLPLTCAGLLAACAQQGGAPERENLFKTPALRQTLTSSAHLPEHSKLACLGTTLETDELIQQGRIVPGAAVESFRCDEVERIGDDQMIVWATLVAGGRSYPVQTDLRLVERRRMADGRRGHGWTQARYLFDGKVVVDNAH